MAADFQIFVKPVSADCNLACTYCYYLEKKGLYPSGRRHMDPEVLESYISQHINASSDDPVMFSWHGGEPLLAGLEFYREAVSLQKKYLPAGRKVINGIQTNGTLIDEEWCRFFRSENFITGVSIDGPAEFHDKHRLSPAHGGTHSKAIRGLGLLQKFGIPSEILCVVSSSNVGNPLEVYDYLKSLNVRYITFLPLVKRDGSRSSGVTEDSVAPEDLGNFLTAIFDEWIRDDIGKISIQIFEEALRTAFGQEHTLCIFRVDCGGVPVIEHNGDFYSCDHYVDSFHIFGNVMNTPVAELLCDPRQLRFGKIKSQTLPRQCLDCEVLTMCNGECPKNRFSLTPDGESNLNYLCRGYKTFFTHCMPFIEAVRQTWLAGKT